MMVVKHYGCRKHQFESFVRFLDSRDSCRATRVSNIFVLLLVDVIPKMFPLSPAGYNDLLKTQLFERCKFSNSHSPDLETAAKHIASCHERNRYGLPHWCYRRACQRTNRKGKIRKINGQSLGAHAYFMSQKMFSWNILKPFQKLVFRQNTSEKFNMKFVTSIQSMNHMESRNSHSFEIFITQSCQQVMDAPRPLDTNHQVIHPT